MNKKYCPNISKNLISLISTLLVFVLLSFVFGDNSFAATSQTINFQGKIVRNDTGYEGLNVVAGAPACVITGSGNDTCDFQVKYYDASSGGNLLLTETFSNVEIGEYNGAFNLSLGSDGSPTVGVYSSLEEAIMSEDDMYVELLFAPGGAGSFTETFSRMSVQATAYALRSKYASQADTAFQFDSSVDGSGYTSASAGMVYYDSDENILKMYNGGAWVSLATGGGSLFTDHRSFVNLTDLTDSLILGSDSYAAIGTSTYDDYIDANIGGMPPFAFDMGAERLTLSGSQQRSGLTVYSNYSSSTDWPLVSFKIENNDAVNTVLELIQDGTGDLLSLMHGSTEVFKVDSNGAVYLHNYTTFTGTTTNRLYNVGGDLYWNGSALGSGSGSSLWTDGGTFSYLTDPADDVVIGGTTAGTAKFFFDVSTGNFGIGTSTPGSKLEIAGASSFITNTTGNITISADDAVVIKANDTEVDNIMEWRNSSNTVLSLINQNGYATFGSSTSNTGAMLTLGANTSSVAQLNLASSSGTDVAAPVSGDLWWNGTNLYFFDGSDNVDLLKGTGGDLYSEVGSVSNGSYLNVNHNDDTYEVLANGWVCVGGSNNAACSGGNWKNINESSVTVGHNLSNQWNDADSVGIIRTSINDTDIQLTNTTGFNYGLYVSPVIPTPSAQTYGKIRWDQDLDTYGKISIQTRTGNSTDSTDGTWESWKPFTTTTNYLNLEVADTHTNWIGTNATVSEGDVTRDVAYFEDEDESTVGNITKLVSSTIGGYAEATIASTDLSNFDYISAWVRSSEIGNVIKLNMGEVSATEQEEYITIDTTNVWQKVYWDISDIANSGKNAVTKLRFTNLTAASNTIYIDNVRAEKFLTENEGSVIESTPNNYLQYRVIFTTTNLSYQPKLENISFTYNSGYRVVIYDSNNVRLYNYTGATKYLKLDVATTNASTGVVGGDGFTDGVAVSTVANGEDAVAFTFNTSETFDHPTSKLLSVMNNSVEKMYLDAQGNLFVSGSIMAGKGLVVGLINNSGSTVSTKSLVTLDSTTNNSFKTTNIEKQIGAFGVVQGVDINNDIDKDGNCDNGDKCLIAFEGLVDVNLDNAATASKGDYVFSSTTVGKGTASLEHDGNGLVGVVASTANSGSGYVGMVFNAQNKVTADIYLNVGFDKNAYRDIYHLLADKYNALSEAERRGLLGEGSSQALMFDNFVDGLKTDSDSSTVGLDYLDNRMGLWGGDTIDNSALDIVGNRYLGSATAILQDSYYYDRAQSGSQGQDSDPYVLSDIGVDPNWYNGVSLQISCKSNCLKNSNLSPEYNGSLFKVTGTYGVSSEHGYVDIKVLSQSPTGITAKISSSDNSCSVASASLTFGQSYSFTAGSCSGSNITITPLRAEYNSGDTFRIASWLLEPTTANDRGSKRVFPEHALIIGSGDSSYNYITIVDTDTQKVWMKMSGNSSVVGSSNILLNNASHDVRSVHMMNGMLYIATVGGGMEVDFVKDSSLLYDSSYMYKYNGTINSREGGLGYTISSNVVNLASTVANGVHSNVIPSQKTEEVTVGGWGYIIGDDTTTIEEIVNLPYTFNSVPSVLVSNNGYSSSEPSSLDNCSNQLVYSLEAGSSSLTNSNFQVGLGSTGGNFSSSVYYCYTWEAKGTVSPRTYSAWATDQGVTVVRGDHGNSFDLLYSSTTSDYTKHVQLTSKGDLYYTKENSGTNTADFPVVKYGVTAYDTNLTSTNSYDSSFIHSNNVGSPGVLGVDLITDLYISEGTSNISKGDNTIYISTEYGVGVIHEYQSGATGTDGNLENNGSSKYYTKDYITETMVGDKRAVYGFNNNTASDLEDLSGNGNTLVNNGGITFANSGIRGEAASFNGTNQYFSISDYDDFSFENNTMSVSFWMKKNGNPSASEYLLLKNGYEYGAWVNTNGTMQFILWTSAGANVAGVTTRGVVTDNQWHHVAFTSNGSVVSAYIDGVLDSTSTSFSGSMSNTSGSLYIGDRSSLSDAEYEGFLDEIMLTGTYLKSDNIKNIYDTGRRALDGSHSLGDTYNKLNGSTNDVRSVMVTPDGKYMYVGTEGGGISKIDLRSDTLVDTYTTSTDPLTSTNNIELLSGRNYPVFSGDVGSSGMMMGIDGFGNESTGTYYSNMTKFDQRSNKAYLWMNANIDPDDVSANIDVYVSNDNGSTYVEGNLIKTNTNGKLPEYEYSFDFTTSGDEYKVKFVIDRGAGLNSSIYIKDWALAQMDISSASGNGVYSQQDDGVVSGSYIEVRHGQGTYNLLATGWVFDDTLNKWLEIQNTDSTITHSLSNQWNDADSVGMIRTDVRLTDVELSPGIDVGTGADGAITVSSDTNINTASLISGRSCSDGGDAVNYSITAFNAGGTEATLSTSPSTGCLNIGDEVLVINLQGTPSSFDNVGNYETLEVQSVSGSTVTFKNAKTKYYGDNGGDTNIGTSTTNQRVMLQRVPNYTNVTVSTASDFYPSDWDGTKGGVLFFRANGSVVVGADCSINANGKGYTKGLANTAVNATGGYGAESFCAPAGSSGVTGAGGVGGSEGSLNGVDGLCGGGGGTGQDDGATGTPGSGTAGGAGGGGGGARDDTSGYYGFGGSGGGGGYGTVGQNGEIRDTTGTAAAEPMGSLAGDGGIGSNSGGHAYGGPGGGGGTYGDSSLNKIYFGSGGGAGGRGLGILGGNGGDGGGILYVSSSSITVSGSISATGENGANHGEDSNDGGGGGGGAGGSIRLEGSTVDYSSGTITVSGGTGGTGHNSLDTYDGGFGGSGRIAVYYSDEKDGETANTSTTSYTNVGYNTYGIYNSPVIATPDAQSYGNIFWNQDLDTYGKISIQTRTGSTSDPTDGSWEQWQPFINGNNYIDLVDSNDNSVWSDINSTSGEGDVTRNVAYFEDEDESTAANITKFTTSTNNGYLEATISSTSLVNYDYLTTWVRSDKAGNTLRLSMGESAGNELYEDISIDASNTWQKVYWDLSDIASASRDAITKIRLTSLSTTGTSVTAYVDNVRAEKLLTTNKGSKITSSANDYLQYRVIFTTTNLSYQPKLENISFVYKTGYDIQMIDANTVRLYNNTGETKKMKLDVILGGAAIDLQSSTSGSVIIAPVLAQVDSGTNSNSIWINKTGTGGNLLRLQTMGSDMFVVDSTGNLSMNGDIEVSGGTLNLGSSGDQGSIRYNAADNVLEFTNDGTNWIPLGSNTKLEVLSAEYPGATLAADGTANIGSMTSDAEGASANSMNYYEWNSSEVSLNDYDVRIRFTLPSDFDGWGSGGVTLNYATESTSTASNKVDLYIYEETTATVDGSSEDLVSSVAGTWTTSSISGSTLSDCNSAGEVCVLVVRMSSSNDNYVRIGDIKFVYDRKL